MKHASISEDKSYPNNVTRSRLQLASLVVGCMFMSAAEKQAMPMGGGLATTQVQHQVGTAN